MKQKNRDLVSAGFGLERLGLLALNWPRVTLALIILITPLLAFSASNLTFTSDIREIFRSGSTDFGVLEEISRQYPSTDRDIILVVQGDEIFQQENLESLRNLHLDLGLIESVNYALSMFTARKPPVGEDTPEPLFPLDLADIEDMEALERAVQTHPIVAGKLLSSDSQLSIVAIALKDRNIEVNALKNVLAEIRELVSEDIDTSRFDVTFTGSSVMRVEIIEALSRDQRIFGLVGMTLGLALCWLFFRDIIYVIIAGTPAAVSVVWLLGVMQLIGQEVNVLTNIVPILVMVIVFSNALHLLFGIRRYLESGKDAQTSIAMAVKTIGPACVLTTATTTIALLSLTLVPHPFVSGFGFTAALGTAVAYVGLMTTIPSIAFFLLKGRKHKKRASRETDAVGRAIEALSAHTAHLVHDYPKVIAVSGIALTLVAGTLYGMAQTRYRYLDNLPTENPAYRAIQTIDEKLSGPNTLDLLLQWPQGTDVAVPSTLDVIRDAQEILRREPAIRSVSSLYGVSSWFTRGDLSEEEFFRFLGKVRSPVVARVFAPQSSSALVSANFSDLDAAELVPVLDKLDSDLDGLRARYKDVSFSLTGIVPVSARASTEMIGQLNLSLLTAIAVIIGLIALAFRSLSWGLISIPPNLLPIAAAGAGLYLTGVGLQFTSVVAFTIGFGIAVDNTIHVLNRYRLARGNGLMPAEAIDETIRMIGPVLTVAAIVLVSGSVATFLSAMPVVRLYGYVSAGLLATALLGGMVFLPALLRVAENLRNSTKTG